MDLETILAFTDQLVVAKVGTHLSDLQQAMLKASWSWERHSYDQIADTYGYSATYLKHDVGPKLWKLLSEVLGEKVNKTSFRAAIERRFQLDGISFTSQTQTLDLERKPHQDWGDAININFFYGRQNELNQLQEWICEQQCRMISILGIGGMGKTSLSIKLSQHLQHRFEWVIWRSLRNALPLQELLSDLLQVLSSEPITTKQVGSNISQLLQLLRSHRCLIVLDNVETLLQNNQYREGYEDYGELFHQLGETAHQSCIVLTSREKPHEVRVLEGEVLPVRSLTLSGLDRAAGQQLFELKGTFQGSDAEWSQLIEGYSGNPLALKIISTTIQTLFNGRLADFLQENTWVFGNLRSLIEQQFLRLSEPEKTVMNWLAIYRDSGSFAELKADILPPISSQRLIEILESLTQRSLIEKVTQENNVRFSLQPVVMEYVSDRLVDQICQEIQTGDIQKPRCLKAHALLKAQASDYVREAQIRFILQPILDRLQESLNTIDDHLVQLLHQLRHKSSVEVGYAGGNLLNLLCQCRSHLSNHDFSNLTLWQTDLRRVNLHHVNLSHSDLSRSAFAEKLGIVFAVAFSPDGTQLATGDGEGGLRIWQVATGDLLLNLAGHIGWVWSIAFSPDGKLCASCSSDKTIRVWDTQTGACLHILRGHTSAIWSVAFSADGQILASGGDEPIIRLWQVRTGQAHKLLTGHEGRILSVAFSPNGRWLASGSEDCTIRVWNAQTGECKATYHEHIDRVWAVAFSPNSRLLASGSADRSIRLWSLKTGDCLKQFNEHRDRVRSIAFHPNSQQFVSSSDDQTVRVWNIATGECTQVLHGHTNSVFSVAFNADGQTIASGSTDQTVKLWQAETGRCFKTLTGYTNSVFSVVFNSQANLLASASTDRTIRLWLIETGTCLKTLKGHQDWVTSVAFHPQANLLASSSLDRTVRLWSVETGTCLKVLQGHSNWVQSVAFSPDGNVLASAGDDQTIRLWSIETGQLLNVLEGHTSWVWSAKFSPNGEHIASSSEDQTIRIWNAQTGDCLQILPGHTGRIQSIAFSPDSNLLASASADETVRVWSTQTGECLHILSGHENSVWAVAFSPDGKVLASGSLDQTVKLWDIQTATCTKTLPILMHSVRSTIVLQPHAQTHTITSGSHDGAIRTWSAETGECLQTFVPEKPYQNTNIAGITGITDAQKAALKALGAIELT